MDLVADTGVPIPAAEGLPIDLLFAAGVDRPSSLAEEHYDRLRVEYQSLQAINTPTSK